MAEILTRRRGRRTGSAPRAQPTERRRVTNHAAPPIPATASAPIQASPPAPEPLLVLPSPVETAPTGTAVTCLGAADAVVAAAHTGRVIVFPWSVTVPLRARTLPSTVAPVSREMLVNARTVPAKWEPLPSVAELVTCQKTWHAWASLISEIELPEAVISVDAAVNTNTAFGSPPPSSVSVPESP